MSAKETSTKKVPLIPRLLTDEEESEKGETVHKMEEERTKRSKQVGELAPQEDIEKEKMETTSKTRKRKGKRQIMEIQPTKRKDQKTEGKREGMEKLHYGWKKITREIFKYIREVEK